MNGTVYPGLVVMGNVMTIIKLSCLPLKDDGANPVYFIFRVRFASWCFVRETFLALHLEPISPWILVIVFWFM